MKSAKADRKHSGLCDCMAARGFKLVPNPTPEVSTVGFPKNGSSGTSTAAMQIREA